MKRRWRYKTFPLIVAVIVLLSTISGMPLTVCAAQNGGSSAVASFQIDFINVGQGDASLVQCDGHYMLIDGGTSKKSELIYSYLKQRSITYLDYMIATHADADHIGGLSGALNYAKVGTAYCSLTDNDTKTFQSFVKYLSVQGKTITVPNAGDSFMLGSAKVTVLGPVKCSSEDNNNSIVLRIVYGNTSFLFTGDAETDEEKEILASKRAINSTVLKVGHHGSKVSTSYQFLKEVSPIYAVISVGKGNSYGHPTEETLSRLRDADVQVFRTDLQGHIICISDGKTVTFTPQKNANADTLAGAGLGQKSAKSTDSTIPLPAVSESNTMVEERSIPPQVETAQEPVIEQSPVQDPTSTEQTYILNTNTKKFHHPNCRSVSQMKEKNKEIFTGSRDDVIARGYDPCGNCHP